MNILETRNLSYGYDPAKNALSNVNIAIKRGCITAVLGGNGAGKSTLFLNLNGVLTPDSGEVFFNGKKVVYNADGVRELRKRVGIVFQDPNDQLFSASVRDDIAFGALNMGIPEDETTKMVEETASEAGVYELLDSPTHALSFGQKKRVAIAGVLIMKPEVIILDEPTAGLDPSGVSSILKLLLRIMESTGITVVISTHDIDIVPLYCDYAYVLDRGEVALEGIPEDLFANAADFRAHSLRIPRIAHLMEILRNRDNIGINTTASTISRARSAIKDLLE